MKPCYIKNITWFHVKEYMMNIKEFEKIWDEISSYGIVGIDSRSYCTTKVIFDDKAISEKWIVGGASGGTCWGDAAVEISDYEKEKEPETWDLDILLEKVYPNIAYLEYKKLLTTEVIVTGQYKAWEYYGNFYIYAFKYVDKQKMIDFLKESNIIK
jgi:hypothetical protein